MLIFRVAYFIFFVILLAIEVIIAKTLTGGFIREYAGDFLIVILVYCFIRAFFKWSVMQAAIIALVFSYVVETLQYFKIVEKLGIEHSALARTLIGTSFEWKDIFAYTLGIGFVLLAEKYRKNIQPAKIID